MSSTATNTTVVLITGANQGLGLEIAKKLAAEQPHHHILIGARTLSKGEDAAKSITNTASGTSVSAIQIDVTSDTSISACVNSVSKQFGKLDVLVNNAGISHAPQGTHDGSLRAEMHSILDTNAVSAACVTESFYPLLKLATKVPPRVIFMSSDLGSITNTLNPQYRFYGYASMAFAYKVSKAAMNMVGAVYAVKWKDEGFKVNMVNPGFRKTGLNGFSEMAGEAVDGAVECCRLVAMGKREDGDKDDGKGTGGYWELEGRIGW